MFFSLAIMVALISESLGLLLASRLSLIVSVDVQNEKKNLVLISVPTSRMVCLLDQL